jgi:hypothetical protein
MCAHGYPERFGSIHLGDFVTSLLNMEIGEPIDLQLPGPLVQYVGALAKQAVRRNPARGLLDQLITAEDSFFEGDFRLLVIEGHQERPRSGPG